jgi:hypothetical protein
MLTVLVQLDSWKLVFDKVLWLLGSVFPRKPLANSNSAIKTPMMSKTDHDRAGLG